MVRNRYRRQHKERTEGRKEGRKIGRKGEKHRRQEQVVLKERKDHWITFTPIVQPFSSGIDLHHRCTVNQL